MPCPSELTLSMFADDELAGAAAAVARTCPPAGAAENGSARSVPRSAPSPPPSDAEPAPVAVADFVRPACVRLAHCCRRPGGAGSLADRGRAHRHPISLPAPLTWIDLLSRSEIADLAVRFLIFVVRRGSDVMTPVRDAAALP